MFPARRFGGGALAVYVDGQPVVDVWTGWADRAGQRPWTENTAPMVFSATKGMASTVIHRLADRGLIDYEAPVAEYWPEFAANGKADMTVRQVMRHQAGLSGLRGATQEELLDHVVMEEKLAAAAPGRLLGKSAYHALTFGWLMSGLGRAVTGKGMATLIREELAEPLGTDGLHLGRPPAEAPTRVAEIICPQSMVGNPVVSYVTRKVANEMSGAYRSMYFKGLVGAVQGDIPLLDAEIPAANGVVTARALARMYGAIANGGEVDGTRFLSRAAGRRPDGGAEPATGPKHLRAVGFSPRLSHTAARQCDARPRACRDGWFGRVGRPRLGSGVRAGAQPTADTVRDDRSRGVRGNLCADPQGRREGAQTRIPSGHGVRSAVLRAGSRRRLSRVRPHARTRAAVASRRTSVTKASGSGR